jgi:PhnB protein
METIMTEIHEVYPYLRVHSTAEAIAFYERAFGAIEQFRLTEPNGRIGHAEIKIGPTTMMLSDEYPEHGIKGPRSLGDPFGHEWLLGGHLESVTPEEMQRRYTALFAT